MFRLREEIDKLLEKYPDPRRGTLGLAEFHTKQENKKCYPKRGIVVDNKDPECLGRLRIQCDTIAPGCVTGWIQVVHKWTGKKTGWWHLPDIGTQVVLIFLGNSINRPLVLGCIYDEKHKPPQINTQNPVDSIVYQCKSHRLEFIDEAGKESITISSARGKMRCVISKDKGIELINELGNMRIKCRKLIMKSDDIINFKADKVTFKSQGTMSIKAKKMLIECDKELALKGKNVKLNATKGVTSGGKQLAAEGNKVMGFDIHNMEMPAGTSTVVVPLPHPFIGKMCDKLSNNVKISNHNAATKGSTCTHDDSMHMQLPGTIKFVNNPKKEGEVTGGTASKVKINGKEAAVIGSTVTTCNDIGMQDNSTIIAVGASIPMPTIINPLNTEAYKEERDKQEKKDRKFTTLKWSKSTATEGEELTLSAQVQDIDDGNMVTLQVWRDGADPNTHIPLARLPVTIQSAAAEATWTYHLVDADIPPDSDPAFFFTAHSAWCVCEKSSTATIELVRPKLESPEWKDADGGTTTKGTVGEALTMAVTCTDMDEGAGVSFAVYNTGDSTVTATPVAQMSATVSGGKAEAVWTYQYTGTSENPLTAKPSFFFAATAQRAVEIKSSDVEIKNPRILSMDWDKELSYIGDTLHLRINTHEVAEFSPSCKVHFFEKDKLLLDDALSAKDITIQADETTVDVEIDLDIQKHIINKTTAFIQLSAYLTCDTITIAPCKPVFTSIQIGGETL